MTCALVRVRFPGHVRIIAGVHRGRRIAAPPGLGTRPMLDRMRESLFSILMPWLRDAVVLDLFAGSGCLSLEALSRGARAATLVERHAPTVRIIDENVELLRAGERVRVVLGDALDPTNWGALPPEEPGAPGSLGALGPPDIVFFDPPYPLLDDAAERLRLFDAVRALLSAHTAPEAVLVFHAPSRAVRAAEFGGDLVVREREMGSGTLWFAQVDTER
jgi:16S rRNA (guanine966-N2)-methyltransferase